MATPAHHVTVYHDGAWSLDHPVTCDPATCAYVDSVTSEFIQEATEDAGQHSRPDVRHEWTYKVTGTSRPTLGERESVAVVDSDLGGDPGAPYDVVEDREAYDEWMANRTGLPGEVHPDGEVLLGSADEQMVP